MAREELRAAAEVGIERAFGIQTKKTREVAASLETQRGLMEGLSDECTRQHSRAQTHGSLPTRIPPTYARRSLTFTAYLMTFPKNTRIRRHVQPHAKSTNHDAVFAQPSKHQPSIFQRKGAP